MFEQFPKPRRFLLPIRLPFRIRAKAAVQSRSRFGRRLLRGVFGGKTCADVFRVLLSYGGGVSC